MKEITITLDAVEAHLALGPIQDAASTELIRSALVRGTDAEYAEIRSKVLQRVASKIADQLIPEPDPKRVIFEEAVELGMIR